MILSHVAVFMYLIQNPHSSLSRLTDYSIVCFPTYLTLMLLWNPSQILKILFLPYKNNETIRGFTISRLFQLYFGQIFRLPAVPFPYFQKTLHFNFNCLHNTRKGEYLRFLS